ncbi:hypothetical protein CCUS01_02806 [Colletotrichum cuscutae]|uniref:Uncharacterized protein n=1 Tax=Colletotrichum cuscutae TaxID=1209917 RepID=A0AAJ0DPH4_9PEZI|nr:hypothetical protein CCUS01_02806 [Colletotrichum cuscutae]
MLLLGTEDIQSQTEMLTEFSHDSPDLSLVSPSRRLKSNCVFRIQSLHLATPCLFYSARPVKLDLTRYGDMSQFRFSQNSYKKHIIQTQRHATLGNPGY